MIETNYNHKVECDLTEFKKYIHNEARKFRHKKLKEFMSKPKEQRTKLEESTIKQWIQEYGKRF